MTLKALSITASSAIALMTGALMMSTATPAQASICGSDYIVNPGDTLSKIARTAYGSDRDFQIIYSANVDTIGPNPGRIEIGMRLDIPCIGGATASTADASVIKQTDTAEALPAPNDRAIRVVTGSGWAPFTDETQEQGGMITEIINVSLENADGSPDYKIDFINDWGAHLQPLISDHAYDFSIAWFKPNCAYMDKLSKDSQFRCNNLGWSEPMFEQIFGYYTSASAATPTKHSDLLGKSICRPLGYATFMLEEKDLSEPNITLVRGQDPATCFKGLADGTFDAVALAVDTAEGTIAELGLQDQVRYDEPLSQVLTIHAVIAKTNPMAEQYLATLDSGINSIKETGEWFQIIRRHLTAHRALTN